MLSPLRTPLAALRVVVMVYDSYKNALTSQGMVVGCFFARCRQYVKAVPELVYLSSPRICAEEQEIRKDIGRESTRRARIYRQSSLFSIVCFLRASVPPVVGVFLVALSLRANKKGTQP